MSTQPQAWPRHTTLPQEWKQAQRGGTRADRLFTEARTSVPPHISQLDILPPSNVLTETELAVRAIAYADAQVTFEAAALGRFMVRSESVASSKIEHLEASGDDYARAIAGSQANPSASSMVAAADAVQGLVRHAGITGKISLTDILDAHTRLMRDDAHLGDRTWAGRIRAEQNWIGGSDHSPRDAIYIPPPPGLVPDLLQDLVIYANRNDIPALVQAAIVHAQFESIHPFTDGNGRIGRALIGAVLQRRGITRNAVVPLASGLFALRTEYFDALNAYRDGNVNEVINIVSISASAAAEESQVTFARFRNLPSEWRSELSPSKNSAASNIINSLFDLPILTANDLILRSKVSAPAGYAAIDMLQEHGIIREVTGRKRDRLWVASDVVDELEDLDRRIQLRLSNTG